LAAAACRKKSTGNIPKAIFNLIMETTTFHDTLTNEIASARNLSDLAAIHEQLKTADILDAADRQALDAAVENREHEIIRLYLPGL
jgi:predicted RNA binding protein with dsRBD fold (UPF0201 family)